MSVKPVIKINNLNITYFKGKPNEMKALKNINLEIFPGEFIIFFGPSGCGKSTLLYAIAGLETNITGEIIIDGKDINKLKSRELEKFHQQKIGMVFQAYYLIGSLSVLKNVILPQVVNRGSSNKERKDRAMELLKKFGVGMVADRFPSELSGGQQQRVATSRALINNPDILLADEPVGNLDSKSSKEVMNLFRELNDTQKKTTILVTHDPSHLNIAHRVFYLKDGEIVDVKKNRDLAPRESKQENEIYAAGDLNEAKLLSETYSGLETEGAGALLTRYKAKEIVSEVLTSFTSDELSSIESYVEKLFIDGVNDDGKMFSYLDKNIKNGGLGLDSRTARTLTERIKELIKKVKILEGAEKGTKTVWSSEIINQVGLYLIKEFKVRLRRQELLTKFNQAVKDRLGDKIDNKAFRVVLNKSVSRGGLGINIRVAKKISNRLELLILGKYKSHFS